MKKIFKALAICAVAGTMCAGVATMAACGGGEKEVTGVAYGLVHGAGYVGYASVTTKGDDVKAVTLTEVCFPTQVKNEGALYETVKYGNVTMTADGNTYKVGNQALTEYFKSEANCKTYYEAVKAGNVAVVVGGNEDKTVMTWNALCKDENGYWTRQDSNGNDYSRWKLNRDATVKYVLDYGVEGLLSLSNNSVAVTGNDVKEGTSKTYWTDTNGISTGATWTDMNSVKEGSTSYSQLIVNAYNASHTNAKIVKGEAYGLTHGTNKYISYASVTLKGDKVVDANLIEIELPTQIKDAEGALYATVKYGDVTMTLDGSDYKVGDKTLNEYFQTEANCKAFYEAAKGGSVKAYDADGEEVKNAMTWAVLCKTENGYWTRQDADGDDYSRWIWNRDATINFVKENGVKGLENLVKETEASVTDPEGATKAGWVWVNGDDTINTGATWSDLFGEKEDANGNNKYVSYADLILNAYNKVK